jgi:transposase-like protein
MSGRRQSAAASSQRMRKRSKIDLETKMKIITKYETGQRLSAIARELGLSASTVNTIVKNADRIKEHVRGCAPMKSTIITKQRSRAIYETENFLTMWINDQIQKHVPLNMALIKAKARSLYGDIKEKFPDAPKSFVASNGWFIRFKKRAGLHIVKASAEAASSHAEAAGLIPSEAAEVKAETQAEASEEPQEEPKFFTTQEMSLAFRDIAAGMARFGKMDSNAYRFLKVQTAMEDAIACYREIYEEKRKTAIQSGLS